MSGDDSGTVSRRQVLLASGGALATLATGTTRAHADGSGAGGRCRDATLRPSIVRYGGERSTRCSDDHEATKALRRAVRDTLETDLPTVGALLDRGYLPYFDFATASGENAWSHWINPAFVGDDAILDPDRPESVLVDHRWWRPIGVMFVATSDGDRVDPPPAVYRNDDGDGSRCRPWHAHVGIPGRYAWWKYRLRFLDDRHPFHLPRFPCRTPWMLHVWTYPHPESVYAHHAPPRGSRGGPPAEPAGFDTDAVPGEDDLGWAVLPDAVRHRLARG